MSSKKSYTISHQQTCDVYVEKNLFRNLDTILKPLSYTSLFILCDETTEKLFLKTTLQSVEKLGIPIHVHKIPTGEESKRLEVLKSIFDAMLQKQMDRKSAVIALGGGVVGDIATTISGLYFRGIDCIQIPTTLLSQVDSSMGGKGAVDLGNHKNTIGIIKQPRLILIDPNILSSLPHEQIISGMGEIVKYAISMDKELFEKLLQAESFADLDMEWIIQKCITLKMTVVEKDPMDLTGIRAILNFGHTLGQSIELLSDLSHGKAIAVGMHFAILVSEKMQLLSQHEKNLAKSLIQKYELPITISHLDRNTIFEQLKKDKKTIGGEMQFVLLKGIGNAIPNQKVAIEIIYEALQEIII